MGWSFGSIPQSHSSWTNCLTLPSLLLPLIKLSQMSTSLQSLSGVYLLQKVVNPLMPTFVCSTHSFYLLAQFCGKWVIGSEIVAHRCIACIKIFQCSSFSGNNVSTWSFEQKSSSDIIQASKHKMWAHLRHVHRCTSGLREGMMGKGAGTLEFFLCKTLSSHKMVNITGQDFCVEKCSNV